MLAPTTTQGSRSSSGTSTSKPRLSYSCHTASQTSVNVLVCNKYIMAATTAYPPGGTFLDTLKRSFTDVSVDKEKDNAISTSEFLEAAESLTTLFGTLL